MIYNETGAFFGIRRAKDDRRFWEYQPWDNADAVESRKAFFVAKHEDGPLIISIGDVYSSIPKAIRLDWLGNLALPKTVISPGSCMQVEIDAPMGRKFVLPETSSYESLRSEQRSAKLTIYTAKPGFESSDRAHDFEFCADITLEAVWMHQIPGLFDALYEERMHPRPACQSGITWHASKGDETTGTVIIRQKPEMATT